MRKKIILGSILALGGIFCFALLSNNKEESNYEKKVVGVDQKRSAREADSLEFNARNSEVEVESLSTIESQNPSNAAYRVLDFTWIKDKQSNAAFVQKYARHEMEKNRLETHNKFVHRRSLVELNEPFRDLAKTLMLDPAASEVSLPAFDGKQYDVVITKRDGLSKISGTLRGHLAGDPESDVIITYYEDASSAVVKSNRENVYVDYSAYDDGQVIMNDVHEHNLVSQHDCRHCNNH